MLGILETCVYCRIGHSLLHRIVLRLRRSLDEAPKEIYPTPILFLFLQCESLSREKAIFLCMQLKCNLRCVFLFTFASILTPLLESPRVNEGNSSSVTLDFSNYLIIRDITE